MWAGLHAYGKRLKRTNDNHVRTHGGGKTPDRSPLGDGKDGQSLDRMTWNAEAADCGADSLANRFVPRRAVT